LAGAGRSPAAPANDKLSYENRWVYSPWTPLVKAATGVTIKSEDIFQMKFT